MKYCKSHIALLTMAMIAMATIVQDAAGQLPVRTRDLQLISNNNTNFTSVRSVNGQVVDWTLELPPTAGATGSLLTSTVAANTATMSWLPPAANGYVLQLTAGAPSWQDLSGTFWTILGNAGTNPALNFIGTTDAQPLVVRTANTEAMRILTTGNVGIGTATPTQLLEVEDGNVLISTSGAGTAGSLRMEEDAANGSNYVSFQASSSMAIDNPYTLPNAYPAVNNYALVSSTAGAMSWVDINTLITNSWLLTGNPTATALNFLGPTSANIPLNLSTSNAVPGDIMFYIGPVAGANERASITNTRFFVGSAATNTGLTVYGAAGTPNVRLGSISGAASGVIPAGFDRVVLADANGDLSQATYAAVVNTTAWTLTGNSGTNPATNFLGTTDAQPLVIRTGNTEAVRVLTSGNVGIGTATPSQLLEVEDGNVIISTSGASTAGTLRFEEDAANGNNYIGFRASSVMAADNTYTLPPAYPAANNYVLVSSVAGNMTWADANTLVTNSWLITGNTGLTAWNGVTGNFLGTTDATDVVFNTNNVYRAKIIGGAVNTGNMVIGALSTSAPVNATAAQATDKLTVLGGDLSFNSETNAGITRQILFRGTAGSGNFRIGSDGGDIFWQGGGGNMLQMGSYWGMRFYGNQAAAGLPAFTGGAATDPTLNLIVTRTGSPGLAITRSAGMTANQMEFRTSAGAPLTWFNANASLSFGPHGAAAGNTGEERFLELAAGGTNYVGFKAPDALAADNIYVLPTAYPAANGYILASSTLGVMSWTDPSTLAGNDWHLTGNAATNPATDFLGTTDGQPLVIRTNNTEAVRILTSGNVGIGTSAPSQLLEVEDGNVLISTSGAGTAGQLRMEENAASGNNYIAFTPAGTMANDNTYTMPAAIGTGNQYLRIAPAPVPTATAATLEWATVVAQPSVEQFNVLADNTVIAQANATTYMRLVPDAVAGNRTTTIGNGATDGQVLTIRVQAAGANGVEFIDGGNMRLSGNNNMNNNDSMTLIWDANEGAWIETSRRNN